MNPAHHDGYVAFRIANQNIVVRAPKAWYAKDIEAFTKLYERSSAPHDLSFDFLSNGNKQYLILNEQEELWHGESAPETVAAFEIQLYTQVIQNIFPDFLSLHAGCVTTQGEAWMFAGISGAGKSSLTTAALLSGADYMTDEFSLLDTQGNIHPMPRPMQWDEPEHPAFPHHTMLERGRFERYFFTFPDYSGQAKQLQLWLPTHVEHQALPLTRLVLPQYNAAAPAAQLQPVRRSEALMMLAQHFHQNILPSERIKQLNQRIPQDVMAYRLNFSDVHQAWASLLNATPNTAVGSA